ncbi:uncharacterized protein LOC129611491 [Condylostylus longicornis]|uniref:uncharacterized protein LOC129611491 n=1 Tax=Condylostylus longicornis TaxID=2530218 RepID=UPI00244DD1E1|nr:uncharacterized protein LOC129611491 [Condylostylus longicornis]
MYKTIRHGENSLQYTILPQNDDFRVENGKISNGNGIKGKYKNKGEKRKSIFAYFGLLFICTVIIGAILIPFLVSTQCLPNPTDWFTKNKNLLTNKNLDDYHLNSSHPNGKAPSSSILSKTLLVPSKFSQTSDNTISEKTFLERQIANDPYSKKSNGDDYNYGKYTKQKEDPTVNIGAANIPQRHSTDKNKMHQEFEDDYKKVEQKVFEVKPNFHETERNTQPNILKKVQSITEMQSQKESLLDTQQNVNTNIKNEKQIYSPEMNFTQYLTTLTPLSIKVSVQPYVENKEVPVLSNLTKKTIILPILAKTNSVSKNNKNLEEQGESESWIKSHWPFIDPSTYFQWTGYKTEDSIILPAILGAALVSIILFASLCFITRNKKNSKSKGRKRNRIVKIEESGDDNATLLTTSNLSDDE